jgi:hypothetical protein
VATFNAGETAKGYNRRALPRFLDSFRVKLGAEQQSTVNVSASGLYVTSDTPPPRDAIVHLILELPDGGPPLQVQAIVIRQVLPDEAGSTGKASGAAVQFIGADDGFHQRMDAYLKARKRPLAP